MTNYGLTCSKCAIEDWSSKFSTSEDPNESVISLDDVLEIEESSIDDEDD